MSGPNIAIRPDGNRYCRECARIAQRARRARGRQSLGDQLQVALTLMQEADLHLAAAWLERQAWSDLAVI